MARLPERVVPPLPGGWTGKGETIVSVDSCESPTILADTNTFSQAMDLPALTSKTFEIVYPDGQHLCIELFPTDQVVAVVAASTFAARLFFAVERNHAAVLDQFAVRGSNACRQCRQPPD
jgi:hypothetical protein